MESSQDPNLTSYLKSMFTQINGEQHSPPPVAAARLSKSSLSEDSDSGTTDLNNNEHANSPPPPSPAPPPPPPTADATAPLANGSIVVDVIVHNDATNGDVLNGGHEHSAEDHEHSLAAHNDDSTSTGQSIVNGNRIALSFLDELKHTLQVSKPVHDEPPEPAQEQLSSGTVASGQTEESHKASLEEQKGADEADIIVPNGTSSPPAPAASATQAAIHSYASSVQDDEGSANEEVSVESGISVEDDLESQSSIASEPNHASTPNGTIPEPSTEPTLNKQTPLTRSASTDLNGTAGSTSRRVVMRSVSQDVKFKLEAIKEEKKVTKSHVSNLASFWKEKGKVISPKDKQ